MIAPEHRSGSGIKKLGVVYTPSRIAASLTKAALRACSVGNLRILEPSVGDGAFLRAIVGLSPVKHHISAIDIDGNLIRSLVRDHRKNFSENSKFVKSNFLEFSLSHSAPPFDLVLGNPPFIRKRDFSSEFAASIDLLSNTAQFNKKDLKNSWAAFIVAAEALLNRRGVMAFIVPYELVNVDYGLSVQRFLSEKFYRVDIYVPAERAFETIEQDAVAFIAQKRTSLPRGVYIHGVNSLENIDRNDHAASSTRNLAHSKQFSLDAKSYLLDGDALSLIARLRARAKKILDYCTTATGVVTGANDLFILSKRQVEEHGLQHWCVPIVKKGAYLPHTPILTTEALSCLQEKHPSYLLRIGNVEPELLPDNVKRYLESVDTKKYSERYKCRIRKPWYSVPIAQPRPAFFFKRSFRYPRIVINEANVVVTDTAYGIQPARDITAKGICFSFYNSMTLLFSEVEGRFYSGGVLELTPNEFRSLPLCYIEPSQDEFERFTALHDDDSDDIAQTIVQFGNGWLSQKLSLTDRDIFLLNDSWMRLRNHRLRHGTNKKS